MSTKSDVIQTFLTGSGPRKSGYGKSMYGHRWPKSKPRFYVDDDGYFYSYNTAVARWNNGTVEMLNMDGGLWAVSLTTTSHLSELRRQCTRNNVPLRRVIPKIHKPGEYSSGKKMWPDGSEPWKTTGFGIHYKRVSTMWKHLPVMPQKDRAIIFSLTKAPDDYLGYRMFSWYDQSPETLVWAPFSRPDLGLDFEQALTQVIEESSYPVDVFRPTK